MSVNTSRGQIFGALKEMRFRWVKTREQWDDDVAREFQENFWDPLEAATVNALGALDRLGQVLLQIRQECGDGGASNYEEDAAE